MSHSCWFVVAVSSVLMACVLLAQQKRPAFEVASVKPSKPQVRGEPAHGEFFNHEFANGRVSVEAVPFDLIEDAYGVRNDQMVGGPGWISIDYYSVIAKAEHPVGASEMWLMMASLLEDRFHLKVHREKRQMPVYKLSVASGGLKLRQGVCASWEEHGRPPAPLPGATFALPCGRLVAYVIERGAGIEFVGGKIPMSALTEFLTRQLRHPAIDETGYKGTFDVDLKLSSEEVFGHVPPDSDPSGLPTAAGAFRKLGIQLELIKGPVEMLVIDSIDRPTPN